VSDAVRCRTGLSELKVPNTVTQAAMAEADEIGARNAGRFESSDDLISDIEKARGK
jgi:hypothetical protein